MLIDRFVTITQQFRGKEKLEPEFTYCFKITFLLNIKLIPPICYEYTIEILNVLYFQTP